MHVACCSRKGHKNIQAKHFFLMFLFYKRHWLLTFLQRNVPDLQSRQGNKIFIHVSSAETET